MMSGGRFANVLIGSWLFVSSFFWYHYPDHFTNSWIVGLLTAAVAGLAVAIPGARFVNTGLAAWLFLSTLFMRPVTAATLWHNVIVAVLIGAFSLIRTRPSEVYRPRAHRSPLTSAR